MSPRGLRAAMGSSRLAMRDRRTNARLLVLANANQMPTQTPSVAGDGLNCARMTRGHQKRAFFNVHIRYTQ
jgi:hypothetical protein